MLIPGVHKLMVEVCGGGGDSPEEAMALPTGVQTRVCHQGLCCVDTFYKRSVNGAMHNKNNVSDHRVTDIGIIIATDIDV